MGDGAGGSAGQLVGLRSWCAGFGSTLGARGVQGRATATPVVDASSTTVQNAHLARRRMPPMRPGNIALQLGENTPQFPTSRMGALVRSPPLTPTVRCARSMFAEKHAAAVAFTADDQLSVGGIPQRRHVELVGGVLLRAALRARGRDVRGHAA